MVSGRDCVILQDWWCPPPLHQGDCLVSRTQRFISPGRHTHTAKRLWLQTNTGSFLRKEHHSIALLGTQKTGSIISKLLLSMSPFYSLQTYACLSPRLWTSLPTCKVCFPMLKTNTWATSLQQVLVPPKHLPKDSRMPPVSKCKRLSDMVVDILTA